MEALLTISFLISAIGSIIAIALVGKSLLEQNRMFKK